MASNTTSYLYPLSLQKSVQACVDWCIIKQIVRHHQKSGCKEEITKKDPVSHCFFGGCYPQFDKSYSCVTGWGLVNKIYVVDSKSDNISTCQHMVYIETEW